MRKVYFLILTIITGLFITLLSYDVKANSYENLKLKDHYTNYYYLFDDNSYIRFKVYDLIENIDQFEIEVLNGSDKTFDMKVRHEYGLVYQHVLNSTGFTNITINNSIDLENLFIDKFENEGLKFIHLDFILSDDNNLTYEFTVTVYYLGNYKLPEGPSMAENTYIASFGLEGRSEGLSNEQFNVYIGQQVCFDSEYIRQMGQCPSLMSLREYIETDKYNGYYYPFRYLYVPLGMPPTVYFESVTLYSYGLERVYGLKYFLFDLENMTTEIMYNEDGTNKYTYINDIPYFDNPMFYVPTDEYRVNTSDSSFEMGHIRGRTEGLEEGKEIGRREVREELEAQIEQIKKSEFERGRNVGLSEGSTPWTVLFSAMLSTFGAVLGIEILPDLTIGMILAVPLVLGLLAFIIGVSKGGKGND